MGKYLVFDMGGVIMEHDIPGTFARFRQLLGDNYEKAVSGERGKEVLNLFENGAVSGEEFIAYVMGFCLPDTSEQDIIDAWNIMHAGIPKRRIEMLRELKNAGHTLYLLSNNNEIHWKDICDHYDLSGIFDDEFLSFREHCSKPDEKIFRLVMERTGHSGPELTLIDDLEANRTAASELGWATYPSIEAIFTKIICKSKN